MEDDHEGKLIVKDNKIIEASYKLSLQEQRIILFMSSHIMRDDDDFHPVKIEISKFASLLCTPNTNHSYMQQVTKDLLSKVVVIKEGLKKTIQTSWLSSAVYIHSEGAVELRFDPNLKPYLLNLKERFTKYQLKDVIRLKHSYSVRFYELLKQYEVIGRRYFLIEELKRILGVKDDYKLFGDLKKRILVPVKKEFDEKYGKKELDFTFIYEEKKEGRKVVGIWFEIIKSQIRLELFKKEEDVEEGILDVKYDEIKAELIEYKLTKKQIKVLFKKYSLERIKLNIEITAKRIQKKEIKNPPAFLLEAIEGDYASNQIILNKNSADNSLISEANKCWGKNKGSCAAMWDKYKNIRNNTCYFCKKFEKQRDSLAILNQINGL